MCAEKNRTYRTFFSISLWIRWKTMNTRLSWPACSVMSGTSSIHSTMRTVCCSLWDMGRRFLALCLGRYGDFHSCEISYDGIQIFALLYAMVGIPLFYATLGLLVYRLLCPLLQVILMVKLFFFIRQEILVGILRPDESSHFGLGNSQAGLYHLELLTCALPIRKGKILRNFWRVEESLAGLPQWFLDVDACGLHQRSYSAGRAFQTELPWNTGF